tara:strand:- start:1399 stop:1824 length:426 start_codon:yes stop_codon:yes gene_type:complete
MATIRELNENDDAKFGLSFPLRYDVNNGGFFPTTKRLKEQAASNLKNLLLTSKGERMGQPDFGSDLPDILFEPITDGIGSAIETTINEAVTQWLPYLTIQNVFVTTPEESPNSVMVQIEFTVDLDDPNSVEVLTLNFNSGI